MSYPKNVALNNYVFFLPDVTNVLNGKTGLVPTMTVEISKDGAAFGAASNTPTEIAYGYYKINFTQAERNADTIIIHVTDPSAATWRDLHFLDDQDANVTAIQAKLPTNEIMGSSDKTDKDDEIDAIKAKTDNLPADPASETNVNANETKIDALQVDVTETKRIVKNKLTIDKTGSNLELWNDTGTAIILTWAVTDKDGLSVSLQGTGPANRGVPS